MTDEVNRWISQEKIEFYRENGFVQVNDVLSSEELQELREYAEKSCNRTAESGELHVS